VRGSSSGFGWERGITIGWSGFRCEEKKGFKKARKREPLCGQKVFANICSKEGSARELKRRACTWEDAKVNAATEATLRLIRVKANGLHPAGEGRILISILLGWGRVGN